MRIQEIRVDGLFGVFDHDIRLRMDDRITIIHAPNGFGKTIILKLIESLFHNKLSIFEEIPFKKFQMKFNNGSSITIEKKIYRTNVKLSSSSPRFYYSISGRRMARLSHPQQIERIDFIFKQRGKKTKKWNAQGAPSRPKVMAFENFIPNLIRIGPRTWRDRRTGESLSPREIVNRYKKFLPGTYQGPPSWLEDLWTAIPCKFIETQRLHNISKDEDEDEDEEEEDWGESPELKPVVSSYAHDLTNRIRLNIGNYATLSQSLDRGFPRRVIEQTRKDSPPEKELLKQLADLDKKRTKLMNAGLLDKEDEPVTMQRPIGKQMLPVLSVYVQDAHQKLAVFDDLYEKIRLFTEMINKRFNFKVLHINGVEGFSFVSELGTKLKAVGLSSGEQHELILLYDLLFEVEENSIILIDEPELSLHVAWQKQFISDLEEIIKLKNFDAIVATHSPQIINRRWELTVELEKPVIKKSKPKKTSKAKKSGKTKKTSRTSK